MLLRNPSKIFSLPGKAFKDFRANDPLRMAGATAFFTTFALPAVLIILIQVFGLITSPRLATHQLLQTFADVIGDKTAGDRYTAPPRLRCYCCCLCFILMTMFLFPIILAVAGAIF